MAGTGSKIANTLRGSAGFYAAIAIACWSTVATAFKWALEGLTPASMLFIATTSAIAALFILLYAGGYRGDFLAIPWKAWKRSAFLGLVNPFLYYLILFKAYSLLPAQVAQALNGAEDPMGRYTGHGHLLFGRHVHCLAGRSAFCVA